MFNTPLLYQFLSPATANMIMNRIIPYGGSYMPNFVSLHLLPSLHLLALLHSTPAIHIKADYQAAKFITHLILIWKK